MGNNMEEEKREELIKEENTKTILGVKIEKISLEERFKNYDGPNLCKDFDWGKDVGREILDNIDNS